MRHSIIAVVATLAICVPASAQLSLAMSGDLCPGDSVTASVSGGGANLLTLLAVGETLGSTTIGTSSFFSVTIDLDAPFVMFPIGFTDSNGDVDLTWTFPSSLPAGYLPSTLHFQAGTVDFSWGMGSFGLTVETSNTDTISSTCP